ncbi:MAG: acetyl-CoA carboxylase biotin carboxyl carrier protein [Acidobacteriota bacterium]|nr:acetyl-CoA carboxylase biotin carboxyl carrier protein [Acidobacteriota bacterium]
MSENTASAAKKSKEQTGDESEKKKRAPQKSTSSFAEPSLNIAEVRELANLVEEHGFTDFEFENEKIRIRLSKNPAPQIIQAAQQAPFQNAPQAATTSTTPVVSNINKTETVSTENPVLADDGLHKITSPIVGTFYSSPAPDKEPYVKEGSKVSPETTVCIVEAMKLMNEIQAEVSGEVVKIYAESGQPVEYGQPLFGIRK